MNNVFDGLDTSQIKYKQQDNDFDLYVYTRSFELLGITHNYTRMQWLEHYYGKGYFELYCVDDKSNIDIFQNHNIVYRKDRKTAMEILSVYKNSQNQQLIVRGRTLNVWMEDRVIWPTINVRNVEQGMYSIVEQCTKGDRKFSNFKLAPLSGLNFTHETQFTLITAYEALKTLCEVSGLGFYIGFEPNKKEYVFTVYSGLDRSYAEGKLNGILYSEEFQNLSDIEINEDNSEFKNVAYVAGAGEGSDRAMVIVGSDIRDERRELPVDARDLQQEEGQSTSAYQAILRNRGIEKLNDNNKQVSFTGTIDSENFDLPGDIVTVETQKYSARINTRLIEREDWWENNIKTLRVTMGTPQFI